MNSNFPELIEEILQYCSKRNYLDAFKVLVSSIKANEIYVSYNGKYITIATNDEIHLPKNKYINKPSYRGKTSYISVSTKTAGTHVYCLSNGYIKTISKDSFKEVAKGTIFVIPNITNLSFIDFATIAKQLNCNFFSPMFKERNYIEVKNILSKLKFYKRDDVSSLLLKILHFPKICNKYSLPDLTTNQLEILANDISPANQSGRIDKFYMNLLTISQNDVQYLMDFLEELPKCNSIHPLKTAKFNNLLDMLFIR